MRTFERPNILISACLEHSPVRYDGTMISDETVRKLKEHVEFITVCPEMAIGMPAPRDSIRLVERKGDKLRLLSSIEGIDFTDKMLDFSHKFADKMKVRELDGAIFKAKSPTCGIDKIKVYQDTGKAHTKIPVQNGMFSEVIKTTFPDLITETERRLSNFLIREHFYIQIFTLASYRSIKDKRIKDLVDFHSKNKYLFMAYQQKYVKQLGSIVANHEHYPYDVVYDLYKKELHQLLQKEPTRAKKVNVITHIYGYFKNEITKTEKDYFFGLLDDFQNARKPYSSLTSYLQGLAVRFDNKYLLQQTVFEPYPKVLITELDSGKNV